MSDEYYLCCDVIMTLIFFNIYVQHSSVINSSIFQVIIAVRPITLVMGKYHTKIKLGSRHCGNWFWIMNNCCKISGKGLDALLSESSL